MSARWPEDRHRDELDDPLEGYRAGQACPDEPPDPRRHTHPVGVRFACMDPDLIAARRAYWALALDDNQSTPPGHYPGCTCAPPDHKRCVHQR